MTARKLGGFVDPADEELAQAPEDYTPLPPDWAQPADVSAMPDSDPSEGLTAPPLMEESRDSHVPPELRVSTLLARQKAIEQASQHDQQRQQQEDMRNLILQATTRGKAGQPRNIGTPEMQKVLAQYGAQPEKEPAYKLSDLEKLKTGKPVDLLGDQVKQLQILKEQKALTAPPKAAPVNAFTELTPDARAYWEPLVGPLPPHATLEDVKTKQGSYANPKASQQIAAAGVGLHAATVKAAADEKTAKTAGSRVLFGNETWELPEGVNPGDTAVGDVRKAAGATAMVDTSLNELKSLFAQAVANPTDQTIRAKIKSRSGILAPKMNQVLGQGAMAAQEYERVKQSIGDLGSKEFWLGALQSMEKDPHAGAALVGQIEEARKSFRESFESVAKAAQYRKTGGASTGKVLMRRGDDFQWVDPKDVEAARKDGYFSKGDAQ